MSRACVTLLAPVLALAATSAWSRGLPRDVRIEGAGNTFVGGTQGPPAVIKIIGFTVANAGKASRSVLVRRVHVSRPGAKTSLPGTKILSVHAESVSADGSPNERGRPANPAVVKPGETVHIDVEIEGVPTTKKREARVWLDLDGKQVMVRLPLKVQLRVPPPRERP